MQPAASPWGSPVHLRTGDLFQNWPVSDYRLQAADWEPLGPPETASPRRVQPASSSSSLSPSPPQGALSALSALSAPPPGDWAAGSSCHSNYSAAPGPWPFKSSAGRPERGPVCRAAPAECALTAARPKLAGGRPQLAAGRPLLSAGRPASAQGGPMLKLIPPCARSARPMDLHTPISALRPQPPARPRLEVAASLVASWAAS